MSAEKDRLYARWLSGEISPEELEQLRRSGELAELEAVIKATDRLTMPPYDAEQEYQKLKSTRTNSRTKIRRLNFRRALAVAAGFLVLATAFFLFFENETNISAQKKENVSFTFSDNSTVNLNDGSSILFNEKKWSEEREVKLEGEAVFSVEKGSPFIVKTSLGQVEVLGTRFNVRARGKNLYVECYRGKVRVKNESSEIILTKNQTVNIVSGIFSEKRLMEHQEPFWSSGSSRFYDENLNEVFAEFERQFDIKVNAPEFNRTFSGNFRHENPEDALNAICKPMNLNFEFSKDRKDVEIK